MPDIKQLRTEDGPNLAKGSICTFAFEKLSEKINFEV